MFPCNESKQDEVIILSGSEVFWFEFLDYILSPDSLSSMSFCNLIKTSSGTPWLDRSMMTWWLRKTTWGRDVCNTSSLRWKLSNLNMLLRKMACFPGSLGSSVRTPLQPAKRTWNADGLNGLPIFRTTWNRMCFFRPRGWKLLLPNEDFVTY